MTTSAAIWRTVLGRKSKYKETRYDIIGVVQGQIMVAVEMKSIYR